MLHRSRPTIQIMMLETDSFAIIIGHNAAIIKNHRFMKNMPDSELILRKIVKLKFFSCGNPKPEVAGTNKDHLFMKTGHCGNSKAVPVKLNYTEELKKLKEPLELRRDHTSFCYPYYDSGAKSSFGVIRTNDSSRAMTNGEKDECEKEIKAMAETVSNATNCLFVMKFI
uniref:Uncharacterized protein n=1 Tax=Meloidogyne incognita TaxID=6306 RepID=A0A914N0Z4_MELIC